MCSIVVVDLPLEWIAVGRQGFGVAALGTEVQQIVVSSALVLNI